MFDTITVNRWHSRWVAETPHSLYVKQKRTLNSQSGCRKRGSLTELHVLLVFLSLLDFPPKFWLIYPFSHYFSLILWPLTFFFKLFPQNSYIFLTFEILTFSISFLKLLTLSFPQNSYFSPLSLSQNFDISSLNFPPKFWLFLSLTLSQNLHSFPSSFFSNFWFFFQTFSQHFAIFLRLPLQILFLFPWLFLKKFFQTFFFSNFDIFLQNSDFFSPKFWFFSSKILIFFFRILIFFFFRNSDFFFQNSDFFPKFF